MYVKPIDDSNRSTLYICLSSFVNRVAIEEFRCWIRLCCGQFTKIIVEKNIKIIEHLAVALVQRLQRNFIEFYRK